MERLREAEVTSAHAKARLHMFWAWTPDATPGELCVVYATTFISQFPPRHTGPEAHLDHRAGGDVGRASRAHPLREPLGDGGGVMSLAQRVAAAHHELRPRRYMAGFPKWIAVVGTLVCVGIGAALVFDLPLHVLKVLVFAWAVVMSFLNVAVHMWIGDGHIQRAQESRRIEARRIESAERRWDV